MATVTFERLVAENDELRRQLAEANEALDAIRHGDVDAVVVDHPTGPQVYTLTGADQPYRVMVEEMQEGAVTLRDDGIIMYCNKQIARMLGASHQALLGVSFRGFVAADSLPAFESLWQRSRSEPSRGEVTVRAVDGTKVEVYLTLNVIPSNEPIQTSVLVTDLTEHKRHQELMVAEAFSRQRAIELSEADRRKDEFLAMLAHELRNPLAPIRNGIDVLRIAPTNGERASQILDIMEEQAYNLVRLIDDLMDVSRCTRGKLELKRQHVALSKIIKNAIQTAKPLILSQGHDLAVTQAQEGLRMHGDPTRLTQIVSNLLNNAAQYTHPGGNISLTTERIGSEVAITVKDNGRGIAADMLPRVFEMFVQVDSSLNRMHGGLGIGLTLVKSLVEMHGGTVKAASDGLGKGCEFTVRLPILQANDVAPDETTDLLRERKSFPPHRILIVDDVQPITSIVALLLRSYGQDVCIAASGAEALAMIEEKKPELIFSDISMPEMTGHELAREIRRRPEWNDIYLVAVTGYGQDSDKKLAKEAGFNDHVVKPIRREDLERLLRHQAQKAFGR